MKHLSISEFNRFIDNELAPQEKEAAEKHFAECNLCSTELQNLQSIHSLLMEQQEEKAFEGIEKIVMKRISRKIKNDKSQKTFFSFIISLFSVGILFILGFAAYEVSGKVFPLSVNDKIAQQINLTSEQIKSFIHLLTGEKTLQSFEAAMLLFFALSIYFIIEKYKTIRH